MHVSAFDHVRRVAQCVPPLRRVVEFGSKEWNGNVRDIFTDARRVGGRYHGIDLESGRGVDEVADAASWRTKDKFDAAVCCEVFEHTDRGAEICVTAKRCLVPGGLFVATCASPLRAPHGRDGGEVQPGEHYAGVTGDQLSGWLLAAGFELVCVCPSPPEDTYAVAWVRR